MYQKGLKDDPTDNQTFYFEGVNDSAHHIIDPIKWLIIMALRTSAVPQTSYDDLVKAAQDAPNKLLVWTHPARPVLCAYRDSQLFLDQTARTGHLLSTLRIACELAGMVQIPATHDLRRGAAADVAHLPVPLKGGVSDAGMMLGHTRTATDQNVTRRYVGSVRQDVLNLHLQSDFDDAEAPKFAPQPFRRQDCRQSLESVSAICVELGMDPANASDRSKAGKVGMARRREEWVTKSHTARELTDDEVNESLDGDEADPRVRVIRSVVTEGSNDLERASTVIDSLGPDDEISETKLTKDGDDFIRQFSSRNDYHYEIVGNTMPLGAISGGSRDPPSRWRYACLNAPYCKKTFISRHLRDHHSPACDPYKPAQAFACDDCETTFPDQTTLNTHKKYVHGQWEPKQCDEEGCGSTEVFITRGAYMQHRQNYHSVWAARECPECPELGVFAKRNAFVAHLQKRHPSLLKEMMPPKTAKRKRASLPETTAWQPTYCRIPQCTQVIVGTIYKTRDSYMQHLRIYHQIKSADAGLYMPAAGGNERTNVGVLNPGSWEMTYCLHPTCDLMNTYPTRAQYFHHFLLYHKIPAAEMAPYMPRFNSEDGR